MSFDPTDPWGNVSPWDVAGQTQTPPTEEPPVTNSTAVAAPNPFKIGFTLKAASGYDAEWLTPTVYGSTAEETAQRGKDLLLAMRAVGLIDLTSQAAEYTRGQFKGGAKTQSAAPAAKPSFQNGQVQYAQQAPPAPASAPGDTCTHGRTQKSGTGKKGAWTALFCNGPRGQQCDPIWQ
jgi:hypothetical protein